MLHTHDYKQPSGYEDKRIVVIDIGTQQWNLPGVQSRYVGKGLFTPSNTDIDTETDINPQI